MRSASTGTGFSSLGQTTEEVFYAKAKYAKQLAQIVYSRHTISTDPMRPKPDAGWKMTYAYLMNEPLHRTAGGAPWQPAWATWWDKNIREFQAELSAAGVPYPPYMAGTAIPAVAVGGSTSDYPPDQIYLYPFEFPQVPGMQIVGYRWQEKLYEVLLPQGFEIPAGVAPLQPVEEEEKELATKPPAEAAAAVEPPKPASFAPATPSECRKLTPEEMPLAMPGVTEVCRGQSIPWVARALKAFGAELGFGSLSFEERASFQGLDVLPSFIIPFLPRVMFRPRFRGRVDSKSTRQLRLATRQATQSARFAAESVQQRMKQLQQKGVRAVSPAVKQARGFPSFVRRQQERRLQELESSQRAAERDRVERRRSRRIRRTVTFPLLNQVYNPASRKPYGFFCINRESFFPEMPLRAKGNGGVAKEVPQRVVKQVPKKPDLAGGEEFLEEGLTPERYGEIVREMAA